jgi:hypothetical protein
MKYIVNLTLALIGVLAISAPAHTAPITLTGGTAGSIPGVLASNDLIPVLFPGPQIGGYFGSQIHISVPVQSTLRFEFFGAESAFNNEFNFFGSELFDHPGSPITIIAPSLASALSSFQTQIVGSGLLPFRFEVNGDAGFVANGANPDDAGGAALGPNFFATCNPFSGAAGAGGTTCASVYLLLDDGGAGPDDNHDDFLVRITVVPEPALLGLIGLGLAGRVIRTRRRRQPARVA